MVLLPYGPEPYASANSAIPAFVFQCSCTVSVLFAADKGYIITTLTAAQVIFFTFFTVLSWLLLCNWRGRTVTLTESSVPDLLPDARNALPPHARRPCNPSLQSHLPLSEIARITINGILFKYAPCAIDAPSISAQSPWNTSIRRFFTSSEEIN